MNSLFLNRRFRFTGAIAVISALAGCQTPLQFPTPGPNWRTGVGQLQYVTPQRSVIGEAVVSHFDRTNFQLDFVAGPGVPLMRLRQSGDAARAEGMFARGSWQGTPARVPGRLKSWVALRDVFAALDATRARRLTLESPDGKWIARVEQAVGQPRRISIDFPETGERFVFVFGNRLAKSAEPQDEISRGPAASDHGGA
ncbi:MAG: hypothetical protein WCP06_06045 [Verrucomicrobiota bacterium]